MSEQNKGFNNANGNLADEAANGVKTLIKAGVQAGTGDEAGALITAFKGIKGVLRLFAVILFLIAWLISALPTLLTQTLDSFSSTSTLIQTYETASKKTIKEFQKSYDTAYALAESKAKTLGNSMYFTEYEVCVNSVYGDNEKIVSDIEVNEIMAIHGVLSYYSNADSDVYASVEHKFSSVDEQESRQFPRSYFKQVKEYAQSIYVVGEPQWTQTGEREEREPLLDEYGHPVKNEETGEQEYYTYTVKLGVINIPLARVSERFKNNEIMQTKKKLYDEYQGYVDSGTVMDKSLTQEYFDNIVENCIISMTSNIARVTGTENSSANGSSSVQQSSVGNVIKKFLASEKYAELQDMLCVDPIMPFSDSVITSRYESRILNGKAEFHSGIDFSWAGCRLADIPAVASGYVIEAYGGCTQDNVPALGYGNKVVIYHGKLNGKDFFSVYGHCEQVYVSTGQTVQAGQSIAGIGQRGNSTGYHLHLETDYAENGSTYTINPISVLRPRT